MQKRHGWAVSAFHPRERLDNGPQIRPFKSLYRWKRWSAGWRTSWCGCWGRVIYCLSCNHQTMTSAAVVLSGSHMAPSCTWDSDRHGEMLTCSRRRVGDGGSNGVFM